MNEFNLTTSEGLSQAAKLYLKDPDLKWLMLPMYGPMVYLGKKAFDYIKDNLPDTEKVIAAQKEAAEAIIAAGKEQGVSKVKIKMSQKAGADIKGSLKGYEAKFELGSSGDMTIEVEYK
ncbi:hypothetical protein [Photobacterium ganghwense]|uniref:hypothetical protein n=1 Tax=Photobacterium ganghwense TaxID=320778 RepID=UPI0039F0E3F5